jgi:hypothetical protein
MTWLGFRVSLVEDRLKPRQKQSFEIIIGGLTEDGQPFVHDPGAEEIVIDVSPEKRAWLAEMELKYKRMDEEAEMRKRLAEIGKKEDENPLLSDYPLPENMQGIVDSEIVRPEKPKLELVYFMIGQTRYVRDENGTRPINDRKGSADFPQMETVREFLDRKGF